ncbi:hypothetical protein M422DRAFT_25484 [Sphaerobolus stellatus SS14]|nr:hypothetical protein M422DRAFT_25484 [Sphaerobolus stellatus SS14]
MANILEHTSLADIEKIHAKLTASFRAGKARSIEFRKEQLLQLAYMIKDNMEAFQDSLYKDLGRPKFEGTMMDINTLAADALFAYANIDKWAEPYKVPHHPRYSLFNPVIHKEPKGVVLIIGPYNYPFFCIGAFAGAIAAGCAAVIKPSELVPATSQLLAELFPKYFDQELYRIINGAVAETTKALTLKWDHILYTGSGRVGRIVAVAAAKNLTPITLELGGKSPTIVHSSTDFEITARRILWGRMTNSGQTCLAPDYVVILKKDRDRLVAAMTEEYKRFYGEDPLKSDSFGRLRAGTHWARVNDMLKRTKGRVILGGQSIQEEKYVAPTVVVDVDWDDSLMEDEIFGPVLPIISVPNYEVALEYIRDHDEPLTVYVFHNDPQFSDYVREQTQSGTFIENDVIIPCGSLVSPLGGKGASGMGSYKGEYSFLTFSHSRSTYQSAFSLDTAANLQSRYPPYKDELLAKVQHIDIPFPRPEGINKGRL